ncbi:MAG: polysaccharide biosynthesis protein [Chloroflexaceae bacterium]|nr:polysaccharide biosynthesis protein [Chloroflexaceae bacterium]
MHTYKKRPDTRLFSIKINPRHGYNRYFFLLDALLLALAAYFSFVLRLDQINIAPYWYQLGAYILIAMPVVLGVALLAGVYKRYWHYAALDDLLLLMWAVACAAGIVAVLTLTVMQTGPAPQIPRSIPFIFAPFALIVTLGPRLGVWLFARQQRRRSQLSQPRTARIAPEATAPVPAVIIGAGQAGVMVLQEMRQNPQLGVEPIGFLDDDPKKHNLSIQGVSVLGDRHSIGWAAREHGVQQAIIAIPTAAGKTIREILGLCEEAGVQTKVIPGLYELLNGKVNVKQIRDVQIEDLLRREPVRTDTTALSALVQGKRVLVTGAGGSIGSELCRQLIRFNPAELIILGHGENSIFEIHNELRHTLARLQQHAQNENGVSHGHTCHVTPVIADIRLASRIQYIFEQYCPHIVFHAAAHKHVPLMEHNPTEAITNNLLGTRNVVQAAQDVGVERFVMISTDKAVNPTSVMGASKCTAELIVHQASLHTGRPYVAVRFGNVLGSRGSVVLTFKKQIAAGGPVTVTDPEMQRYFMTIPEAVQLVLQAAVMGRGGEVFTLDMGEQVKIVDLARDLIELSGLEVGRDIDIVFTGIRPGEKLYEELFASDEAFQRTDHHKIFIAQNASTFVPQHLDYWVESLALAAEQNDDDTILLILQQLIPQHQLGRTVDAERNPLARELLRVGRSATSTEKQRIAAPDQLFSRTASA